MALASTGSWNEVTPQFFTSAMERGAQLGLSARAQDTSETEAADRLKLAYDSLAEKERVASELAKYRQQQASAALLLRSNSLADTQQYRADQAQRLADTLAETHRHNLAMETKPQIHFGTAGEVLSATPGGDISEIRPPRTTTKAAKITLEPQAGTDEQGTLSGDVTDPAIQERLAARKLRASQTGKHEITDWIKGKLGIGSAKPAAAPSPALDTNELVEITNPSGKRVRIKKSQLDDALKQGYKQ